MAVVFIRTVSAALIKVDLQQRRAARMNLRASKRSVEPRGPGFIRVNRALVCNLGNNLGGRGEVKRVAIGRLPAP